MPLYSYKATDPKGKIIEETMAAADESEVLSSIQSMGYIPIRIAPSRSAKRLLNLNLSLGFSHVFSRVSGKDLMLFTQDLATLLGAGLPVDRALSILVDVSENEKMKEIVRDILKIVNGGGYLSDAFAKYPKVFPKLYVNMVRAGEAGGVLEPVLDRLGIFLETSQDLKDYIKSALIYPVFLVCVGGLSIIILMTYVIPKFSVIFSDMGGTMPLSTRMLLAISEWLQQYWWIALVVLAGGWYGFSRYASSPDGRVRIDRFQLKLPVMKTFIQKMEVARFTRTLGTLIKSGVPILQALELVQDVVGNAEIAAKLTTVRRRVKEGDRLSVPLTDIEVFPSLAIQMVTVGEETGRLEEMLLRVAENYEKVLKNMVKRLIGIMEPAMILIMGVIVAFVVISMLMAVFSMNDMPF
jgi:general secretion pathway protein F